MSTWKKSGLTAGSPDLGVRERLFWETLLSFLVNIRRAFLWQSVRLDFVFGVVTSLFSFVNMTSALLLCFCGTLLG